MRLSIWLTELKVIEVAKSPGVRLTHRGTADKRMFFREPISVRKSLSCFTSEIRAWSERSVKEWVVSAAQPVVREVDPPIRSARSRVSGRSSEDGRNGRTKPRGSGKLRSFAAFPKVGAARTRCPPCLKEGCKCARSKRRCARVCSGNFLHGDKDCRWRGCDSLSTGLVPCFHSMSVETPSPSWSR